VTEHSNDTKEYIKCGEHEDKEPDGIASEDTEPAREASAIKQVKVLLKDVSPKFLDHLLLILQRKTWSGCVTSSPFVNRSMVCCPCCGNGFCSKCSLDSINLSFANVSSECRSVSSGVGIIFDYPRAA